MSEKESEMRATARSRDETDSGTDPRQMCLQLVLGVHVLLDAVSEGAVDVVPLVDHGRRALVEQRLDLDACVLGGGALALRPLDVVVAEACPRLRYTRAARGSTRTIEPEVNTAASQRRRRHACEAGFVYYKKFACFLRT